MPSDWIYELGALRSRPTADLSPRLHGEDLRLPLIAFLIWSCACSRPRPYDGDRADAQGREEEQPTASSAHKLGARHPEPTGHPSIHPSPNPPSATHFSSSGARHFILSPALLALHLSPTAREEGRQSTKGAGGGVFLPKPPNPRSSRLCYGSPGVCRSF